MSKSRRQSGWLTYAATAVAILLALLLLSHVGGAAQALLTLPLLILGIVPLAGFSLRFACLVSLQIPDPPFLRALFQRPPPNLLA